MAKKALVKGEKKVTYKGVYYGEAPTPENPGGKRYISVAHAEVVDMLCEGGIDGLVHQVYSYPANREEGDYGWGQNSVTATEFISASNQYLKDGENNVEKGKMCSIYWNEIPVVDKTSGKNNFADVDIESNQSVFRVQGFKNKRIKAIGEVIKGSEENQISHYKHYKIYNKECSTIRLSLKVAALGKVDRYAGTSVDPNDNYGQLLDSDVTVGFWYRAMYSAREVASFTNGKTETIQGNVDSGYIRDIVLALPLSAARADAANNNYGDFLGWEIQIIRQTAEPTTQDIKNTTVLDSIQEEILDNFSAPNSYIIKSYFNAEYFGQIPERAFDTKLLKVKIPSNYDPISKHYSGTWDGTFKAQKEWTDNPAWCFHDLITNKRYGLGKYIDTIKVDKWTLYEISKYCDQLVISAEGGLEPRFTCNVLLQTREDAFQLLTDMASIFRAMIYYATGTVYAVQDSKKDSVFQFTNSDVENGDFTYTSTSAKVRHTVAIVRYNDKNNFYKPAVEYIDDIEGIRRYGIKEKEITAFGCTSRGQAIRMGKWILATERLETETCSFVTGAQGSLLRPGDIFTVADAYRLMKRRGGRVTNFTRINNSKFTILLDSKLEALDSAGDGEDGNDKGRNYELTLSAPSFFFDPSQTEIANSSQIQFIRNHHVQKFTVTNEDIVYDSNNTGKSLVTVECDDCLNTAGTQLDLGDVIDKMSWSILSNSVDDSPSEIQEKLNQSQRFRVINIIEKEINKYEISAAEYSEDKYDEIDKKLAYTNTLTFAQPQTPVSLGFDDRSREITANTKAIDYNIVGNANKSGLSYYAVYVAQGTGNNGTTNPFSSAVPSDEYLVDKVYSIDAPKGTFIPSTQAQYFFRAYAVNALEQYSNGYVEGYVTAAQLGVVQPIKDVKISSLRLADDTEANQPGTSDPNAGVDKGGHKVDEFDGTDIRIAWQTTGLGEIGVNTSFEFTYRIRIYEGYPETGTLLYTNNDFKPMDWDMAFTSFELPESDLINLTKDSNGDINLDNTYRSLSFIVDARDYASTPNYSSTGNETNGRDILYVENPAPRKADAPCGEGSPPSTVNCLQGLVDINGHIKIFNLDRPIDAQSVYIIAAKIPFTYLDYVFATETTNTHTGLKRSDYAFNLVKISPISSDDPVFEIDPSFKTDDMDIAYVSIAYTDDFDERLIAYKDLNAITWDIDKKFARFESKTANSTYPYGKGVVAGSSRVSNLLEVDKVTPEVMDLIGEGWKAWIKIDVNGNWKGRNIECIKEVPAAEQSDYKGYMPFYCGRRIPWLMYRGLYAAGASVESWTVDIETQPHRLSGGASNISPIIQDLWTAGCLYFMPDGTPGDSRPDADYTGDTKTVGGYDANDTGWSTNVTTHPYYRLNADGSAYKLPKTFKRYRVYFKTEKNFDVNNYWVMGMNVNHKPYFTTNMVRDLKRLITPAPQLGDGTWEEYLDAGAFEGIDEHGGEQLPGDNLPHGEVYLGGSDAYFNYHPAGFVQGFGGLDKTNDYFDVHLGHLIDGSYLTDAIFFVMATTQDEKGIQTPCPP